MSLFETLPMYYSSITIDTNKKRISFVSIQQENYRNCFAYRKKIAINLLQEKYRNRWAYSKKNKTFKAEPSICSNLAKNFFWNNCSHLAESFFYKKKTHIWPNNFILFKMYNWFFQIFCTV